MIHVKLKLKGHFNCIFRKCFGNDIFNSQILEQEPNYVFLIEGIPWYLQGITDLLKMKNRRYIYSYDVASSVTNPHCLPQNLMYAPAVLLELRVGESLWHVGNPRMSYSYSGPCFQILTQNNDLIIIVLVSLYIFFKTLSEHTIKKIMSGALWYRMEETQNKTCFKILFVYIELKSLQKYSWNLRFIIMLIICSI